MRRLTLGLIWIGFIGYAFGFAPPDQTDTWELIQRLSTGNWDEINPLIVTLFNLMGVWPIIYSSVLIADGRGQPIPAWPFVVVSFALGAFALLPYLALRQPHPTFEGHKNLWIRVLDSRGLGVAIALLTMGLITYGLGVGVWSQAWPQTWSHFIAQWQTSRFINVMSLDFCILALVFPVVLRDDMARRHLNHSAVFWMVTLIPLLGPAFYLALRPRLLVSSDAEVRPSKQAKSVETVSSL